MCPVVPAGPEAGEDVGWGVLRQDREVRPDDSRSLRGAVGVHY